MTIQKGDFYRITYYGRREPYAYERKRLYRKDYDLAFPAFAEVKQTSDALGAAYNYPYMSWFPEIIHPVNWRKPLFGKNWWWRFTRRFHKKRRELRRAYPDADGYEVGTTERFREAGRRRSDKLFYRDKTGRWPE